MASATGIFFPAHEDPAAEKECLRGFGIELWDIGCQPNVSYAELMTGFGAGFKRSVRERYPARIEFHPLGEVLSSPAKRITVDPDCTDRYGVPVAHMDFDIGGTESKMVEAMYDKVEETVVVRRAEILPVSVRCDRQVWKCDSRARHVPDRG